VGVERIPESDGGLGSAASGMPPRAASPCSETIGTMNVLGAFSSLRSTLVSA
jgi:hypothetical protein